VRTIVDDPAHKVTAVAAAAERDAYEILAEEILAGRLSPNERLVEADLVARLGLSRGAVRIALVRLEQDRIVVREPHRGARVRRVSEEEAVEILEIRAALEGVAAAHAARRATAEQVAAITAIAERMTRLQRAGDLLAMSDANAEMHRLILEASGHDTVRRLISGLKSQLVRFQYRTILASGRSARSLSEHQTIVDAIANRDPDGAEQAMRTHLSNVARALHERADTT
jgi:DNA-binding GntR family transcriptional regulator